MELSRKVQQLELIFRELGIAQYLDIFVEQGFKGWDAVLHIRESELWVAGQSLLPMDC